MAALTFARDYGISYGGWVPKGRTNEAGKIPEYFDGLSETDTEDVTERTKRNVASSDATLVFVNGSPSPGTQQTVVFAESMQKPHLVVDLRRGTDDCAQRVRSWVTSTPIAVLNIAGPRESEAPGIGHHVREVLERCFDAD